MKVNAIVTSHRDMAVVRYASREPQNSFYYCQGSGREGLIIASDALDHRAGWIEIRPSTLLTVHDGELHLRPLQISAE